MTLTATEASLQAPPVRYKVQEVITGGYEKQLVVIEDARGRDPQKSRSIKVYLQDGWIDTPAEVGDLVHVLAHIQEANGAADEMCHATCNSLSGAQTGPAKLLSSLSAVLDWASWSQYLLMCTALILALGGLCWQVLVRIGQTEAGPIAAQDCLFCSRTCCCRGRALLAASNALASVFWRSALAGTATPRLWRGRCCMTSFRSTLLLLRCRYLVRQGDLCWLFTGRI